MLREYDIFNREKFFCQICESRPKKIKCCFSVFYRCGRAVNRLSFSVKQCFAEKEALLCSSRRAFPGGKKKKFCVKIRAVSYGYVLLFQNKR